MRRVSWEIVLAGLTFMAIGIYLMNQESGGQAAPSTNSESIPEPPSPPDVPGTIIIDLENPEGLKQLEQLRELKNLRSLEDLDIKLQNLDKIIQNHARNYSGDQLEEELKKLEEELRTINSDDFNVKLQDQKVYINPDYDVKEAEWTEVSSGVFVYQESFSVADMESMDLEISFGNINVIGGDAEAAELTLRATGSINSPSELSKSLRQQKQLSTPGASWRIEADDNTMLSDKVNMEATLRLPRSMAVTAKTKGGHITASNLGRNTSFETSGGHITLDNIEGETLARTQGGHINGDRLQGPATLSTGGGHIRINDSGGALSAETSGGHIEVAEHNGPVTAKTSGGNISATVNSTDGPLEFTTSAGNVSLHIPATLAADVDVSGSSVNLEDSFSFSGDALRGSLHGALNGGGIPLTINCGYGNVNINAIE